VFCVPRVWCREVGFPVLLIIVVGLFCYANSLHVPFVFDDDSSITENSQIHNLAEFCGPAGYGYTPRRFIGYLTFAVNYHFHGLDVAGYHLVNLAIHLGCALLVFILARMTFQTPWLRNSSLGPRAGWLALFAALLFVAHPVQTQAVTYIVQRLASLATGFYLLALVAYGRARLSQERWGRDFSLPIVLWYGLALLAAGLAMKTKEIAFTLPLAAAVYEFSFFRGRVGKRWLFLAPLLATLLIVPLSMLGSGQSVGALLSDVNEVVRETETIGRGAYLLTQFSVIATYLRLLILPVGQNLDYDYPVFHSLFVPRVMASLLLIFALLGLAAWLYGFRPRGRAINPAPEARLIGFGIVWFFLALAVESSLVPIRDVIFEHRLYLPSVGVFLAIATAAGMLWRRHPGRSVPVAAMGVVLALALATWQRNLVWGSLESIWGDVTAKSPAKARGFKGLGRALDLTGKSAAAVVAYQQALRLDPTMYKARLDLGVSYLEQGRYDAALAEITRAVQQAPGDARAHYNLGLVFDRLGRLDRALEEYHRALALKPDYKEPLFNLGPVYGRLGRVDQAIDYLTQALRLAEKYGYDQRESIHYNLGVAYDLKGWSAKAGVEYKRALALRPDYGEARRALANRR